MFYKVLRISAIVAVIALAVGVTFRSRVSAIFQHQPDASQTTPSGSERKILYWYDAMSPQHHYNKPGKAPDGMNLVPHTRRTTLLRAQVRQAHRHRAVSARFSIGMT